MNTHKHKKHPFIMIALITLMAFSSLLVGCTKKDAEPAPINTTDAKYENNASNVENKEPIKSVTKEDTTSIDERYNIVDESEQENSKTETVFDIITDSAILDSIKKKNFEEDVTTDKIESLSIDIDDVEDLSQLELLPNLKYVRAKSDLTFDIEWLKYCKNIEYIQLEYNTLSDISEINNLRNIKLVDIKTNGLEKLSQLDNVKYLYIDCPEVNDISAIENMKNLRKVVINTDSELYVGNNWSNLANLYLCQIECKNLVKYSFLNTIDCNPVYHLTDEDIEELNIIKEYSSDDGYRFNDVKTYNANYYRYSYDYDKINDNIYLKVISIDEKNSINTFFTRDEFTEDIKDTLSNNVELYEYISNEWGDRYSNPKILGAVAGYKSYEALKNIGFHIEYDIKDDYKYKYIETNTGAEDLILKKYFEEHGNPIPDIVQDTTGKETPNNPLSTTWKDEIVMCDGILYGTKLNLEDMVSDKYAYKIIIDNKEKDISNIKDFLESYKIDDEIIINGYMDHELLISFTVNEYHIAKIVLYNIENVDIYIPQEDEKVHTMSLNFFTSDCVSKGWDILNGEAKYCVEPIIICGIERIEDNCDYCNDDGHAYKAEYIILKEGWYD